LLWGIVASALVNGSGTKLIEPVQAFIATVAAAAA